MIGTTVGKYRILSRLGRGGMGIVYKGLDETLDRQVAIKVLNPDVNDTELLKRFRAEAISLARLNHPGIATIYELHRHGDDLLMVMEFVRGETLQSLSERLGPLEPQQAAHICVQILDALAHAHRAGIVHRDLKPANVMMTDGGLVKVMDFGIARVLGGEHLTHAGYMMGTPAYMAPEQVLGQDVDGRADLYAVGVLFYRLLSRELPFKADTAIAMAQKQVADAHTPLGTFRPNLPPWCETMIAKALSKAPSDRFQSAEAFRSAILNAVMPEPLGELPTMATPAPTGMLRATDVTGLSGAPEATATVPPALADDAVRSDTGSAPTSASASTPSSSPSTSTTSPVERTGTTVVLGRGHLFALAAVLVILLGGIAALGFAAFRRGAAGPETAAAPAPTQEASASTGAPAQPETLPAATEPPVTTVAPPPNAEAPATPASAPAGGPAAVAASGTAGRTVNPATRKPKPEPKPPAAAAPVAPAEPPPAPPVEAAPPPAAPEVAPITFQDMKVLVAQGKTLRERDAVLRLTGDHLAVLDAKGASEILSLPYTSLVQAFFSRSKEPKWKGPDGKAREASVDLGKMSFFRGERNWLILTTQAEPLFLRFENAQLQAALKAVQERTGLTVQR
jgi:serine/threonine protein kinase